jgi:hypothetical protein
MTQPQRSKPPTIACSSAMKLAVPGMPTAATKASEVKKAKRGVVRTSEL